MGDLYERYVATQQDNVGYNLAFISEEFDFAHTDEFDFTHTEEFGQEYMNKLFDYAERKAANGYPWLNEPFGLSID